MICQTALMAMLTPTGWRPTSIGYVDDEEIGARCHWKYEADAVSCDIIFDALADAWRAQVDEIGFAAPIPDDDGLLDVYITDQGTGGGAYTTGSYTDEVADDGRQACAGYIAVDPEVTHIELPTFIAHEFNHVLQMATDFREPTLPMWEGTATEAQHWTYPGSNYGQSDMADFQAAPWLGVLGDGYMLYDDYGLWSYYEYGSEIWIHHLDAVWGDGAGSGARDLWTDAIEDDNVNEPDVLEALGMVAGSDWRDAILQFSAERVRVGTDSAPDWAAMLGGEMIAVAFEAELDASELPAEVVPVVSPYETGAVYVQLSGLGVGQRVRVTLTSDANVNWGQVLVGDSTDEQATGSQVDWQVDSSSVVLGAVNLGADDFDADNQIAEAPVTISIELSGHDPDTGIAQDTGDDKNSGKGCGCAASPRAGSAWIALLLALPALRRRQRQLRRERGPIGVPLRQG